MIMSLRFKKSQSEVVFVKNTQNLLDLRPKGSPERTKGTQIYIQGYLKYIYKSSGIGPHLPSYGCHEVIWRTNIYICLGWLSSLSYGRGQVSVWGNNWTSWSSNSNSVAHEGERETACMCASRDPSATCSKLAMSTYLSLVIQNTLLLLDFSFF